MFLEKRKFKNSKKSSLSAIYEGEEKNGPVVVLCHGYGSSKDSDSTKMLAEKLVKSGLNVYRFDFTGCGESEGVLKELTPEQGIDDLTSAIKDLSKEAFGLYGSSYGGYIALIYASNNPVLALALKGPVSDYPALVGTKGNDKEDKSDGFANQAKEIDIYSVAKNITAPTFIIHGSKDDVVPLEQSEKLLEHLGGEKRLSVLHGANHQIAGPQLEDATTQLAEFFINKLL